MYDIIFYEDEHKNSPVYKLIESLEQESKTNKDAKIQLKQITLQLDVLEALGTRCSSKYVKHIQDEIWELRPGNNRILLFGWKNNKIVLLHHFRKKTNKTPPKEIEQAKREIKDWINRKD